MAVYTVNPNSREPNEWQVNKFAEIGWDETFVRNMVELKTILDATLILGKQREDANNAIMTILVDGLMPAFSELKNIRASVGTDLPSMDRRELYNDLFRKLWKSYKDLMQRAAIEIGFNIGFLFKSDKDFAKELKEFETLHPDIRAGFGKYLEQTRDRWQNDLASFRNTFLEHQDASEQKFLRFYDPKYAEEVFNYVWNTIVEVLAALLESKLPSGTKLALAKPETHPNWPNRFVFDVPHFRKTQDMKTP